MFIDIDTLTIIGILLSLECILLSLMNLRDIENTEKWM